MQRHEQLAQVQQTQNGILLLSVVAQVVWGLR